MSHAGRRIGFGLMVVAATAAGVWYWLWVLTGRQAATMQQLPGVVTAALLGRLRDHPGARQATIFGQAIRALVDDDVTPQVRGLDVAQVRPVAPSLEDVFVTLSRAQQQTANGGES